MGERIVVSTSGIRTTGYLHVNRYPHGMKLDSHLTQYTKINSK